MSHMEFGRGLYELRRERELTFAKEALEQSLINLTNSSLSSKERIKKVFGTAKNDRTLRMKLTDEFFRVHPALVDHDARFAHLTQTVWNEIQEDDRNFSSLSRDENADIQDYCMKRGLASIALCVDDPDKQNTKAAKKLIQIFFASTQETEEKFKPMFVKSGVEAYDTLFESINYGHPLEPRLQVAEDLLDKLLTAAKGNAESVKKINDVFFKHSLRLRDHAPYFLRMCQRLLDAAKECDNATRGYVVNCILGHTCTRFGNHQNVQFFPGITVMLLQSEKDRSAFICNDIITKSAAVLLDRAHNIRKDTKRSADVATLLLSNIEKRPVLHEMNYLRVQIAEEGIDILARLADKHAAYDTNHLASLVMDVLKHRPEYRQALTLMRVMNKNPQPELIAS